MINKEALSKMTDEQLAQKISQVKYAALHGSDFWSAGDELTALLAEQNRRKDE